MARVYADENVPLAVTLELRQLGHDVLTIQDAGEANQALSDGMVLKRASEGARAVLTMNRRDFIRLHHASSDHAGIIVCTFDPDFAGQAHRIHAAIAAKASLAGQLVRVNRPPQST